MHGSLLDNVKITKVNAYAASAGTAINSTSVDMQGFEGVVFVTSLATANAGNSVNVAQSEDNSTFNDLEGTAQVPASDGHLVAIDVYRPRERYVRAEVDRGGTNTVVDAIFAIQYNGAKPPFTSIATQETHVSPAEGTA